MKNNNIPSNETVLYDLVNSYRLTTNDSLLRTIVDAVATYFSVYPVKSGECFQPKLQDSYGAVDPVVKGALSLCHFVLSDRNGFDTSKLDPFYLPVTISLNEAIEFFGQQLIIDEDNSQSGLSVNGTYWESLIEALAVGGTQLATWGDLLSALNQLLTSYPPLYQPVCWFLPATNTTSSPVQCSCPTKSSPYLPMLRASGDLCSYLFNNNDNSDIPKLIAYPKTNNLNQVLLDLIQKLSSTMRKNQIQSNELILMDMISSFRGTTNDTLLQTMFNMATNYFMSYPSKSGDCFQPKLLNSYGELNSIENGVLSLCNFFLSEQSGFDATKVDEFYQHASLNEAIEYFGQMLIVEEDQTGLNVNGSLWEKLIETLTASGTQQTTWGDLVAGLNQLLVNYVVDSRPACWYLPANNGMKSGNDCSCPSTPVALIAGVVSGVVCLIIIAVVVVIYLKKFRNPAASKSREDDEKPSVRYEEMEE